MELLLMGLAGCTGMDVVSILSKQRQVLKDLQIQVRGKRAPEHPKVFTNIEITFLFWGDGLNPERIEQAIQLSEEKYCSASAMLGAVAEISFTFKIFTSEMSLKE